MKFDLTAAKAYVGAGVALAAAPVAHWLLGLTNASLGVVLPPALETSILTPALSVIFGYIAVYFTPNKSA
jgi:hypothetical protein